MEKTIRIKGGRNFVLRQKQPESMKTGTLDLQPPQQQQAAAKAPLSGIEMPKITSEKLAVTAAEDIKLVNSKYPLIPANPAKGERVFAYAHIFFDRGSGELVYNVVEPPI